MFTKNKIRNSFKVRTDNNGSKEIWCKYRSVSPGDFLTEVKGNNPLEALCNIVINLNETLRSTDFKEYKVVKQIQLVDFFVKKNHFDIYSNTKYKKLFEEKKYVRLSYFIFNELDNKGLLKPATERRLHLAICWNGIGGPITFKGRSTNDILRDFAITSRKYNSNLEAHRFGIESFIRNFQKSCSKYFGFDTWNDDAFLKCCIEAGLFREHDQDVI